MEKVLVFSVDKLKKFNIPRHERTWLSDDEDHFNIFIKECLESAFFMDRDKAEHDDSFKQIIPYCILRKKDKSFLYKRSKKGGEERLHDLWSFGVGGHINSEDLITDNHSAFGMALQREITEEVEFINPEGMKDAEYEITALIYDRSNSVGKVHFGVVVEIELPEDVSILSASNEIEEWKWVTVEELLETDEEVPEPKYKLETWSESILLECLNNLVKGDAW